MRRFFDLSDDVNIKGRWHLGEIRASDGSEPRLRAGIVYHPSTPDDGLEAEVTHPGRVLDYCITSFAVPVASRTLAHGIQLLAGSDVQCLPVAIAGQSGFYVLNAVRVVRCLDESRSEFIKWTDKDHRADLAGQYRQVTRLHIDATQVPEDVHVFRIEGWKVVLVVSEDVKKAMEKLGCLGALFEEVT